MTLDYTEIFTLLGLVGSGFVATNLDNLLILVVLLGAEPGRRSAVLLGFIASCTAVLSACALGLALGTLVHPEYLGYTGLVPLLLGVRMLYRQWRGRAAELPEAQLDSTGSEPAVWLGSFALMFSNSGDSIALLLPLFAESSRVPLLLLVSGYLVMALLWCAFAYLISGRRELARRIEQRGEKIVPWVMIGVGIYILMDTSTDTLLR